MTQIATLPNDSTGYCAASTDQDPCKTRVARLRERHRPCFLGCIGGRLLQHGLFRAHLPRYQSYGKYECRDDETRSYVKHAGDGIHERDIRGIGYYACQLRGLGR